MIPFPEVFAHTGVDENGLAIVATFGGTVQWCCDDGGVVQLPTELDCEHIASQGRSGLTRDDGQPILMGRDVPTQEQLAMAEAAGELDPFDGEPEPPFDGRDLVDVETRKRV